MVFQLPNLRYLGVQKQHFLNQFQTIHRLVFQFSIIVDYGGCLSVQWQNRPLPSHDLAMQEYFQFDQLLKLGSEVEE